jgi:hypothetical protein
MSLESYSTQHKKSPDVGGRTLLTQLSLSVYIIYVRHTGIKGKASRLHAACSFIVTNLPIRKVDSSLYYSNPQKDDLIYVLEKNTTSVCFSHSHHPNAQTLHTEHSSRVVSIPTSYTQGPELESRAGQLLSRLRSFVLFPQFFQKILRL